MLAAYMMAQDDLSAKEAVNRVRGARPGSVETRHQETALDIFEKHLGNKKKKEKRSKIVKEKTLERLVCNIMQWKYFIDS